MGPHPRSTRGSRPLCVAGPGPELGLLCRSRLSAPCARAVGWRASAGPRTARAAVGVTVEQGKDGKTRYKTTVRLHDLRHSCASLLLSLGASPRVVMEILGHSGIAITMDTYTHVMPTLLGGAVDGMDELFG